MVSEKLTELFSERNHTLPKITLKIPFHLGFARHWLTKQSKNIQTLRAFFGDTGNCGNQEHV